MYKIIGADEKEYGPVSAEQIQDWVRQGRLTASSKVQPEGSSEWKPLSEIPELAQALPPKPELPAGPAAGGPPPLPAGTGKTSALAIWALVLSIVGFPLCGLGPIAALILGILALVKINQSGGALRGRGLAIAALIIAPLMLFMILPAMLLPALAKAKGRAQSINCMNNMKQLALGLVMYRTDHQDQWPDPNKWCDAIQSYVASDRPFKCAAAASDERSHYAFNTRLAAAPANQVREPGLTVLAFETEGGWNLAGGPELLLKKSRHFGAVAVAYADGHVEMVPRARLPQLRWDP